MILSRLLLTIAVMLFTCASYAKGSSSDETSQRLKEFYGAYQKLIMSDNTVDYTDRAYTLIRKNCTPEFADAIIQEQREGVGSDFVTYDYVDTMIMSTLSISKADDHYEMVFDANWPKADDKSSEVKHVRLAIFLKEGLINDVKEIRK